MPDTPDTHEPRKLRIWQQNLNRSLEGQLDLLQSLKAADYDLVMLQEPCIDFLGRTQSNLHWTVIYPRQHLVKPSATRSIILVNRNITSNNWTEIPLQSTDVTGISLRGDFGTIRIFNIYNDCKHNGSLEVVNEYMRGRVRERVERERVQYIWLGDFNRHHPLWDEERNAHLFTTAALEAARPLLNMIARYDMKMALPKDIPTLEASSTKNYTRVDNVFCSATLLDTFITCDTDPQQRPQKTDHMPILSCLEIVPSRTDFEAKFNYKLTDWKEFCETLKVNLAALPEPEELTTIAQFNITLEHLDLAIKAATVKHVPKSKPSPYSKRWWSKELATMKKVKEKLARKSYERRAADGDPIHEMFRQSRNKYSQAIRKTKLDHWTEWLESLDDEGVWSANRLVTGPATDGGRSRVPTLQVKDPVTKAVTREACTNEEKGELFYQTFFPVRTAPPAPAPIEQYPPAKWDYEPVTDEQIHRAVKKMKPWKATRSGTTPNSVFVHARELLVPHLGPIFRATDTLKVYPSDWKVTETPVLKKPGKADYMSPNAWRPIVLSNGYARLLNGCKTEDLVVMCEKTGILPPNHFGGRPGRATTDLVHLMVKTVKDAWRKGEVASLLCLDVKGAFPSTAVDVMKHEMRQHGVPVEHVEWLGRRLEGRQTLLMFDDYRSELFAIEDGLDQGDAQSLIAWIIYNLRILHIFRKLAKEVGLLYVDDAAALVTGANFHITHDKLRDIMNREGGILEWAVVHNCSFGIENFKLVDLSR